MNDPLDMLIGGSAGAGVGALLVAALKFSGSRNISSLDDTLKSLRASVDVLSKDVRDLREANIGLAKDIGSLSRRVEQQDDEIAALRRNMHRLSNHISRLALKAGLGVEHPTDEEPS